MDEVVLIEGGAESYTHVRPPLHSKFLRLLATFSCSQQQQQLSFLICILRLFLHLRIPLCWYNVVAGVQFIQQKPASPPPFSSTHEPMLTFRQPGVSLDLDTPHALQWKNANMVLLVYDVTNPESFQNLGSWLDLGPTSPTTWRLLPPQHSHYHYAGMLPMGISELRNSSNTAL